MAVSDKNQVVPRKYQTLFQILSPIQKSGILKSINEIDQELEKREKFYEAIKNYLIKYQGEDIPSLVFIITGQLIGDLRKEDELQELLKLYPQSPELQFFKIRFQILKGEFGEITSSLKLARLSDDQRTIIFNRLVSAPRLAQIILDLYSFVLEIKYLKAKQDFEKIKNVYPKAEAIAKKALEWTKKTPVPYLYELVSEMMLEYTRYLLMAEDIEKAMSFFEREYTQQILQENEKLSLRADVLCLGGLIHYSAGQPTEGIKKMERGIRLFSRIPHREKWKAAIYGNYGYMLSTTDPRRSIEAYEKCLSLLEGSKYYQTMTTALSNLISIYNEINDKEKAQEALEELVQIFENNEELITPFRAYSIATNALLLEDFGLASAYLEKLEKKVKASPTMFHKGLLANAKMSYYTDGDLNYQKIIHWGNEALYFFNKQKDYLNVLVTIQFLASVELKLYTLSPSTRYLNNTKKRFHELLSLAGKFEMPEWITIKNIILAGLELLSQNFEEAENFLGKIPEVSNRETQLSIDLMNELLVLGKTFQERGEPEHLDPSSLSENIFETQITNSFHSYRSILTSVIEQALLKFTTLQSIPAPPQADIKLVLLMNASGMAIYTKIFGEQKMDQNLISGFISAIDSFGKQLFGTQESYFSIKRGDNNILTERINKDSSIALIVSKENFDALMTLHSLAKEVREYLKGKNIDLSMPIRKDSDFSQWLEKKLEKN
ncbi:MAG: hypothetical protein GF308_06570 [Candidatus Heimdallarchaeota archaeon]|nr:hypothetical protein [Candidatus Heimdallarchaeota archaeon]